MAGEDYQILTGKYTHEVHVATCTACKMPAISIVDVKYGHSMGTYNSNKIDVGAVLRSSICERFRHLTQSHTKLLYMLVSTKTIINSILTNLDSPTSKVKIKRKSSLVLKDRY